MYLSSPTLKVCLEELGGKIRPGPAERSDNAAKALHCVQELCEPPVKGGCVGPRHGKVSLIRVTPRVKGNLSEKLPDRKA